MVTRLVDSIALLLASSPAPEDVIAYKIPTDLQERLSFLLEKNRTERLSTEEFTELNQFEFLEHIFRVAKARARLQLK